MKPEVIILIILICVIPPFAIWIKGRRRRRYEQCYDCELNQKCKIYPGSPEKVIAKTRNSRNHLGPFDPDKHCHMRVTKNSKK